jgi:hypothetical protein
VGQNACWAGAEKNKGKIESGRKEVQAELIKQKQTATKFDFRNLFLKFEFQSKRFKHFQTKFELVSK